MSENDKAFTLAEYGKKTTIDDYASHSADALMYGLTEPSYKPCRWQRIKRKWVSYWSQYKYIWTILCGGDIHENCGDY